jgi:hypothetical protein
MHVVGHDAPREDAIALPIEMQDRVFDKARDSRILEPACPEPGRRDCGQSQPGYPPVWRGFQRQREAGYRTVEMSRTESFRLSRNAASNRVNASPC